ncbi:uncharacterized protein LOC118277444 [Spodoptera frugiperda]|uniref:Uncharacterized protein LOC118277444 n=1 Tax=Spodoptera frugiperda TaxID=7108 RepID=A0A9R0ER18_SPOFR|nr:uncharacterized protein LOC118277444 [Spodoptera frugiperda]
MSATIKFLSVFYLCVMLGAVFAKHVAPDSKPVSHHVADSGAKTIVIYLNDFATQGANNNNHNRFKRTPRENELEGLKDLKDLKDLEQLKDFDNDPGWSDWWTWGSELK